MMKRFVCSIIVLLAGLAVMRPAAAQFAIQMDLGRKTFLANEPITATVTLTNRSGANVVMGGSGNRNWLRFLMEDSSGRQYPPVEVEADQPFMFQAGETMQRRVEISNTAMVSDIGTYSVKAVAFHPPTGNYYESNRVLFSITEVKPTWEASFGVPPQYENAGRVRVYGLILLRHETGTWLYFRLRDEGSQLVLKTYSLGPISQALDPVFTVDRENIMHAFFLAAPRIFSHVIIGPDGKLISRRYYKEQKEDRPMLVSNGGVLSVIGGAPYDPNAPTPEQQSPTRGVSERPPGL
ncbi:MAG: hypothetical protein KDK99_06200 [Verrucomicrobiales bacterium]|nr:hypothetical protein [Verrucomicrobiales bacterium]